jgi:hypothetical protein
MAAAMRQGVVEGPGEAAGQAGALVAGLVDQEAGVAGQVRCGIVAVFCLHAVSGCFLFCSGPLAVFWLLSCHSVRALRILHNLCLEGTYRLEDTISLY